MREKKTVLDLFCGCGGLSYGFIEAGYEVLLGIDHWKDAITTFEKNHKQKITWSCSRFCLMKQQKED
ncbi:MAG: DNA cytosine methyltransferase [Chitinophagaceae bacterium]|nr:DNA cytosine methyltransferase [Chitinophagaceae bacterium]